MKVTIDFLNHDSSEMDLAVYENIDRILEIGSGLGPIYAAGEDMIQKKILLINTKDVFAITVEED